MKKKKVREVPKEKGFSSMFATNFLHIAQWYKLG